MVNDTTTLNGALSELGETMADNLESMGVVGADASDGLTTLAGKILDIEPSISGLNLDTNVTIHASDDSCLIGQQIMFWAELTAVYDDESQVDVDLSGVLTGATITFKVGNTILGTGVTDSNGVASYTHTFNNTGNYSVTASFSGTDNFDACTSQAMSINVSYNINITSDKPILSSADSDIANITATLSDGTGGVSSETLSYEIYDKDDNVLDSGSDTTDANGEISFTYAATGIGDVSVVVYYGMSLQKTYEVLDYIYYHESEIINYDSSSIKYQTIVELPNPLPQKFILSFDYWTNYEARCGLFSKNNFSGNPNYSVFIGSPNGSAWYYGYRDTGTKTTDVQNSPSSYHSYTIERDGSTFKYTRDGGGNYSKTVTWFDNYQYVLGLFTWAANKTSAIKNIKLKIL